MGLFSFITSEGESLPVHGSCRPTFTVYMVFPDDTRVREDSYGVIGGKDFYEAVAELNGMGSDRGAGANLFFDYEDDPDGYPIRLPRLTRSPDAPWSELKDPKNCPSQGYFY